MSTKDSLSVDVEYQQINDHIKFHNDIRFKYPNYFIALQGALGAAFAYIYINEHPVVFSSFSCAALCIFGVIVSIGMIGLDARHRRIIYDYIQWGALLENTARSSVKCLNKRLSHAKTFFLLRQETVFFFIYGSCAVIWFGLFLLLL